MAFWQEILPLSQLESLSLTICKSALTILCVPFAALAWLIYQQQLIHMRVWNFAASQHLT